MVGGCERLALAFLIAADVSAQHDRRFPGRDQHHVALAHAAAKGYTCECASQVVEAGLAELAIGIGELALGWLHLATGPWNLSTARS